MVKMIRGLMFSILLGFLVLGGVSAWSVDITQICKDSSPCYTINNTQIVYLPHEINGFYWTHTGISLENVSCKYSLNDGINQTINNCNQIIVSTYLNSSEGYNNWTMYLKNISSGEEKSYRITFWVDSIAPRFIFTKPTVNYTNNNFFEIAGIINETNKYDYGLNQFSEIWIWQPFGNIYPDLTKATVKGTDLETETPYYKHTPLEDLTQEGIYHYLIRVADKYPNETKIRDEDFEGWIIRDKTNPTLTITSPNWSIYNHSITQIYFSATDTNLDYCTFSNGSFTSEQMECSSPYAFTSSEGNNTWTITTYDKATNENTSSVSFFVDSIAPTIDFVLPTTNTGNYKQNWIYANISAYDVSLETIIIQLYNSSNSLINHTSSNSGILEINFTNLADGVYRLVAIANDSVSHTNQKEIISIKLDTTAPVISSQENISEEATGPLTNVEWSAITAIDNLDGSVVINCNKNSGDTFILGTTTIICNATDNTGNTAFSSFNVTIVDTTAPTIIGTPSNIIQELASSSGTAVSWSTITAEDLVDGSVNVSCNKNSGDTFILGTTTIICNATDNTGNTAFSSFNVTIVDTTSPTINEITGPGENSAYNLDEFSIQFTANPGDNSETISGCNLSINEFVFPMSFGELRWERAITQLDLTLPGRYLWNITCYDGSGNANTTDTRTFTILSNLNYSEEFEDYTDLTQEEDISNVSWFFVRNQFGIINFTDPIDFSLGLDWTPYINISFNSIEVDVDNFAPFAKKGAIITLYNLTWTTPRILRNGVVYTPLTYNYTYQIVNGTIDGTLIFSIDHFSNYTTEETPVQSSSSGGGSGGGSSCTTTWTCTDWSECNDGQMTRVCSKVSQYCYANLLDKPSETQTCEIETNLVEPVVGNNNETESNEESQTGITGAVIGTAGKIGIGAGIFALLFGIGYIGFRFFRKKEINPDYSSKQPLEGLN